MGKTAKKAIDVTAPGKLHINRSRVAEDHYEYRYLPPLFIRVDILTNPPIYLSPFTWFCFIPDSSSLLFRWSEWLNVILYDCVTTRKHCSRNFSRMTLQLNTPSLIHRSIAGLNSSKIEPLQVLFAGSPVWPLRTYFRTVFRE